MKHFTQILGIAFLMLIAAAMPAVAQNGSQNKAILTTAEGEQQLNTDEISVIRFEGGKVTVEQPWGNTTYDGTLRSLSFQRPNPGTLRLTANAGIGADYGTSSVRRLGANAITGDGKLKSTWESGDKVYVYADGSSTSSIGVLTPKTFGSNSAKLTGDINAAGLSDGQTLYFSTKPRPYDISEQDGTVESLFFCIATATVSIDGGNASIANLAFARPVAIVKFCLMDKSNHSLDETSKLTVSAGGFGYTVTPASPTGVLYVAIPGFSGETVSLSATVGSDTYTYEKTGVTFTDGKYYDIMVKMTKQAAVPEGALSGKFSVSGSTQVYFSKGNLQYDANATTKWYFAEHQYDYIGSATGYPMDLFTWGNMANPTYNGTAYYTENSNLSGSTDWGSNIGEGWYTLSQAEWAYLFETRTGAASKYGYATVADKHGIIIVPDEFTDPMKNNGSGAFVGSSTTGWSANVYSAENWSDMESAGAVFLPAAGYRVENSVVDAGEFSSYWSSTAHGEHYANGMGFYSEGLFAGADSYSSRDCGQSVRLVRQAE